MNLLEEADLCIIEANYAGVLSDLEKRLIEEVRKARKTAEKNLGAADRVVELQHEVRELEEELEELKESIEDHGRERSLVDA